MAQPMPPSQYPGYELKVPVAGRVEVAKVALPFPPISCNEISWLVGVADQVKVLSENKVVGALTVGVAELTVTAKAVAVLPLYVALMFAVPADTPVTTPVEAPTVATAVVSLDQVAEVVTTFVELSE